MTVDVTVISCLYGDRGYDRHISEWQHSLRQLTTRPAEILVMADRHYDIPCAQVLVLAAGAPRWQHPQAQLLDHAARLALTEWVWVLDIDDCALPDALDGIDDVTEDVWQMGYHRSDGVTHLPPELTGSEYLALDGNPFTGASAFRTSSFKRAGGFPDAAFQDWGLWRRLAASGATFRSSGRPHYEYRLSGHTRSAVELLPERRERHMEEMLSAA